MRTAERLFWAVRICETSSGERISGGTISDGERGDVLGRDDRDRRDVGIDSLVLGEMAHELGDAVPVGLLGARGEAEIAEEHLDRRRDGHRFSRLRTAGIVDDGHARDQVG